MVELFGLDASSYAGMSPQQMLGVGDYERGKYSDALQTAALITKAEQARQAAEYQKKKDAIELKMSLADKKFQAVFDRKKMDLETQRTGLYKRQIEVMESQDKRAQEKLDQEIQALATRQERLDALRGIEVKTNVSDKPISLLSMIFMRESGVPVDFAKDSKIDRYFMDGDEIKVVMSDTSVKTIDELRGAKALQTRTEQTTLGPEEKTYKGTLGRQKASLKAPDYISKTREALAKENIEYDIMSQSPIAADRKKADELLQRKIIDDISRAYTDTLNRYKGSEVIYATPKGSNSAGYFIKINDTRAIPIIMEGAK